eukprot:1555901-Rhodomonas_salina.3
MEQFNEADDWHEDAHQTPYHGGHTATQTVSFRRTTKRSDGTLEINAGEALLQVSHNPEIKTNSRRFRLT